MAGDGFDQKQPFTLPVIDDDIRHLAVFIDGNPELRGEIPVEESPLGACVARVYRLTTGDEPRAELVDDLADQFILSPRREPYLDTGPQDERDLLHFPELGVLDPQLPVALEIPGKHGIPLAGSESPEKGICFRLDLVAISRAVDRTIGLIGIGDHQARVGELVECESAECLSGVRGVRASVVRCDPLHDRSHTDERGGRRFPGVGR